MAKTEEEYTQRNSDSNDCNSYPPVEIFLDIKRIVAARGACGNDIGFENRIVHKHVDICTAEGTPDALGPAGRYGHLAFAGRAFEMYNGSHESFSRYPVSRGIRTCAEPG